MASERESTLAIADLRLKKKLVGLVCHQEGTE